MSLCLFELATDVSGSPVDFCQSCKNSPEFSKTFSFTRWLRLEFLKIAAVTCQQIFSCFMTWQTDLLLQACIFRFITSSHSLWLSTGIYWLPISRNNYELQWKRCKNVRIVEFWLTPQTWKIRLYRNYELLFEWNESLQVLSAVFGFILWGAPPAALWYTSLGETHGCGSKCKSSGKHLLSPSRGDEVVLSHWSALHLLSLFQRRS